MQAIVPQKSGKKPIPPGHVKIYKTAIFKIHNPSHHRRAMLTDSMRRAHLAYTRLLAHLVPDIERFAAMAKKERSAEMQRAIYRFLRPLPLGQGASAGVRVDVQGQVNSYIELRKSQEGAHLPTVSRLNADEARYEGALEELATLGSNLTRENCLRDELARLVRSARLRPVSYYGNTRGFYLFLWHEASDRYYAWLNLHPRTSRYAQPIRVENLVDRRTGEVVNFISATGAVFPLEFGLSFHDNIFIKQGRPQSERAPG